MEGRAGGQTGKLGVRSGSRSGGNPGSGRAGHRLDRVGGFGQGRVSEPLVFLELPLPAALTSATLVGGI